MVSFFNVFSEFTPELESRLRSGVQAVAEAYGLKEDYLNIIFMNDEELLEINLEFLNHDYYTDIITFNYADAPGHVEGEIYISLDRVRENAANLGADFLEELLRIVIHGMLHIAGLDDTTDAERANMHLLENRFMAEAVSRETMTKKLK